MTGFDDSPETDDDGLFFAGISADDEDAPEVEEDEDATLADTRVRAAEEPTGAAPMPMLGMGAGIGGAAAVGAYAGQTRADHERSRTGASASARGGAPVGSLDDSGGLEVDSWGRIVADDPWGVGGDEDVPDAFHSGTTATEAPRARTSGGTRASYVARGEGAPASGGAIPGATLGGVGGVPQVPAAATQSVSNSGSQSGGIPLSVLQNLQNNRASGAAFAPMTGVQASGTQGYLSDPSLVVVQAFGSIVPGGGGVDGQAWLRGKLREHELRGGAAPMAEDSKDDDDGAGDDEGRDGQDRGGREQKDFGRDAAGVGGAAAVPWAGGSTTSGSAASTGSGSYSGGVTAQPTGISWNPNPTANPRTGVQPAGSPEQTGTTPTADTSAPGAAAPGGPPSFVATPGTGGWGTSGEDRDHYGPGDAASTLGDIFARGSDFRVASEELSKDADRWRRLAVEMEGVAALTGTVRDGESSFGLVSEPAAPYSRATTQHHHWARQAVQAYEQLAAQLQATAAGYDATEQAAVHGTGRVFDV